MLFAGSLSLGSSQTLGLGCFLCLDDLQTGELFPVLFIQRVGNELYRTLQIGDHHILQGVGPALGLDDGVGQPRLLPIRSAAAWQPAGFIIPCMMT